MNVLDDAHLLYDVATRVGLRSDPNAIIEKIQQLRRGLPAEDEFAAWCVWSGRCALVHRLDQRQYPETSRAQFQVPDFLAGFDVDGTILNFLVEVKSRNGDDLTFSARYYERLIAYARNLALPLLVAFRNRFGLWCLFDIREMKQGPGGAFHANFHDVIKQTLSGVLLGDFFAAVEAGSGLTFKLRELERKDAEHSIVRVEEAGWSRADGTIVRLDGNFLPLLLASPEDVEVTQEGDLITQRFFTPNKNTVPSWFMLPYAVGLDEEVTWREVLARGGFSGGMRQVERAATEGTRHGLVEYVMHIEPQARPDFLPARPASSTNAD